MPIIEGLDNTGKNTLAEGFGKKIHEFPDRSGFYGKEICSFLAGEIEYSSEVEEWFLQNRLDYYKRVKPQPGDVTVRSGISFLVYKWYRTGVEPTREELEREIRLINGEEIIYLEKIYPNPDTKKEIYDSPGETRQSTLNTMFLRVISEIVSNKK